METHFQKSCYDNLPGFAVNHTTGVDAAASTIGHLHFNKNRMIVYFLHGSGNIIVENQTHTIHAGDIVITDARELFHCHIDPETYHERISIHIDPYFWERLPWNTKPLFHIFTDRKKGIGNLISGENVRNSGLHLLISELLAVAQSTDDTRDILAISKLMELLSLLNKLEKATTKPTEDAFSKPLIYQILEYLNTHFSENITVNSVAAAFHITASHLSHLFKKQTGISLWNYVILRRLRYANALMAKDISAEEACYAAGFYNYANFYRLYKKHTGTTPAEYKKHKGNAP